MRRTITMMSERPRDSRATGRLQELPLQDRVKNTCTQLDLVNKNAYIKFGEIMSICSQDIERKRNFGVNQGQ